MIPSSTFFDVEGLKRILILEEKHMQVSHLRLKANENKCTRTKYLHTNINGNLLIATIKFLIVLNLSHAHAKWVWEEMCPEGASHFFDIWHVV